MHTTIIPCFLSLSCHDFTFLEALATPYTINFALFRYIRHATQGSTRRKEKERASEEIAARATRPALVAKAVWWKPPKTDAPLSLKERFLEGEVHLPKALVSSCDFPLFNIEYAIELLPFILPSFTPSRETQWNGVADGQEKKDEAYASLVKQAVDITSFHEFGPVPVAFTTRVAGGVAGDKPDDAYSVPSWGAWNAGGVTLDAFPSTTLR
ncbi:hypothetical protein D9756_000188 [Leucocoprinus leucothites]|uniref:Uncharacterized protein n=1 Tax=Leucocoprinus leucothites TaxID=201217 RepID=A0A8H5GFZ5_9AGAR|nr:hypothetical protein D9756_000188 [Leucoagaricus leucothites]